MVSSLSNREPFGFFSKVNFWIKARTSYRRELRRSEGPAAGRSKRRQKICRLWRKKAGFRRSEGVRLEEARGGKEICRLWWKEAGLCRSVGLRLEEARESKEICRLWWKKAGFRRSEGVRLEEAKGGNEICRLCGRNLIKLAEYKEDGHPCKCLEKCGRPCRKFYDKIHTTVAWIML